MALLKTNTGIGTTNPTSALHVIGDVLVTGVVTSTTFNGNINSGVGTIVNLTNTRLTSGVGTITTLNSNTATILDIDNLRMLSGIATITQINATTIVSTNNDFDHLNANFGNIDVGIVTNISGTRLNYTGVGTITTLNSTNSTLTNLNNERLTSGIATVTDLINTRLTSGIATITDLNVTNSTFNNLNVINLNAVTGVVTDISGSRLNYTGVGTITTLNSTHTNLTNINSTGISTLADIRAERVTVTGIVTANSFRPTSGYIQAADGTNSFYIYDTTGNVAFQGTIGVNQINNGGGYQVITFNDIDTRLTGNLDIAGVTTSSVFNGNIYSLGVSTFRNGPVLIGTGTSTGTAFQPLQVTGGAYVSDNLGLGLISPTSKLDVVGDGRFTGVVTATTFNGDINAGVSTLGIATAINLTSQQLIVSGLSTFIGVTTFQNDVYVSGDLYVTDDLVFDEFTGRNINVTGVATIFNLVGTAATITTSTIIDLSNTRLTSGIATITDLNVTNSTFNNLNTINLNAVTGIVTTISGTNVTYTNSDFINLNANNAFVDVGIVTDISGTRLNYTGVGTITELDTDTATINNLSSDYINVGVATASILSSGIATITDLNVTNSTFTNLNATNLNAVIGVVTDISGTRLNYTGVGTITTLDTDTADINNLTSNYINVGVATASIFNSGIGTITDLNNTRLVSGIATITTLNATNVVSTNSNFTNLNANNAYINVGVVTDISGTRLNYTGVGTITTLDTTNATIDDISNTNITVSGIATIQNLSVLGDFDVYDTTATFHNNLFIAGNLSIGGTSSVITAQDLNILDKEITLGVTTNAFNQDVSTDVTANHGGISIASTEGYPLVDLSLAGFSSLPATYKQLMWVAANSYGVGTTDAWMFNYAVGIGSTLVPNDVRLAVGEVQITDHQINAVTGEFDRLISGIATFTGADISNLHSNNLFAQSGIITDLSGTRLNYTGFGTITNLYSADAYIDDIASNVGFATAFIAERLNVTGVGTIATLNSTTSTITNLNATNSSFTNVNVNNLYAVTGIVTTLTSTHSTLENINSSGISTLNIVRTNTINSSGVVTAPTFVGDLLGVANYAHVSGYSTFSGYSDTTGFSTFSGYANAAGVSTFADYANNAGIATYAWTAGVSTYSGVAGYSTFSGYANAAGVSTFADYANNAGIATYAWTAGVSTYSGVAGYSTFSGYSDTTGFSTFSNYSDTSGFSTFSNYSDTSGFSTFSGYANASGVSTFSGYSDTSGFSTFSGYANNAGIATYAWTAGVSTYSGVAGYSTFSGYSDTSGFSTFSGYANASGVSTSVIGGIASVTQLDVSGIATINQLDVNQLSPDGSDYGTNSFVPIANGVGGWSWQPVTSAGAGTLDGIVVREEGSVVGTAGSITNLDFRGNNIIVTAIPLGAIATITTSDTPTFDSLDVTGVSTLGFTTISSLYVAGVSTFSGITTFIGDVYIGGDLFVDDDIVFDEFTARNIIVTGISSLNILTVKEITSVGVVTAPTFVGDLLGVANYAHISGFSSFSGYSNASGVSTFADYANNAGIATYAWTAGVSTYSGVSGYSTFSGYSDTSGFSTFSGYSDTSGVSTFSNYSNSAGVSTFANYSNNAGIATYADSSGVSTSVIGGIASVTQLNVIGVSTFGGNINASSANFSGNVTIGGTLTYEDVTNIDSIGVITARSDVRVDGNLSVIGITTLASGGGITTTGGDLFVGDDLNVAGDLNFNGILYQNGVKFTSGIGIGSTSVNPQSGIISPTDRIGIGFTDINFVGTGLSITGYGSTVVIDLGTLGGTTVSISTVSPGISTSAGDLWWDSINGDLKIYYVDSDSSQWIDANGGSQALAIVSSAEPSGYGITSVGTLWYNTISGVLNVYYDDGDSTQWVDAYINFWVGNSAGIHTTGNVGVGTTTPTEKLQVNGQLSIDGNVSYGTTIFTTTSTAQVGIHSALAIATYRSVEYTIQATEGTNFHTTKIIALHDGSTVYHTEYGTIFNNVGISTYDVDVSGGKIRLLATPASASTTNFKVTYNGIKV